MKQSEQGGRNMTPGRQRLGPPNGLELSGSAKARSDYRAELAESAPASGWAAGRSRHLHQCEVVKECGRSDYIRLSRHKPHLWVGHERLVLTDRLPVLAVLAVVRRKEG